MLPKFLSSFLNSLVFVGGFDLAKPRLLCCDFVDRPCGRVGLEPSPVPSP